MVVDLSFDKEMIRRCCRTSSAESYEAGGGPAAGRLSPRHQASEHPAHPIQPQEIIEHFNVRVRPDLRLTGALRALGINIWL
jgi:hypothetical protein